MSLEFDRYIIRACVICFKKEPIILFIHAKLEIQKTSNPVCGKSVDAKKTYSCESEYRLAGKNCLKEIVVDAKKK